MKLITFLILTIALVGCNENRSISYYGRGYNPSYSGELSQIGFLKDVADPNAQAQNTHFRFANGGKLMVIQSGQAYPDSELLKALPTSTEVIAISGNPEVGNIDRIPLRLAAKNGNVDFILGFWGTIRNTHDGKIFVIISAILANVREGTWRHVEVSSKPINTAFSFFDPQGADDLQVQEIKSAVYSDLVQTLYGPSTQQGASLEPASPAR